MTSYPSDGTPPPPISRVVPLDRIPEAGGEFAWYHAVAVARQLVDQLIPDAGQAAAASIPELAGLSLHANGVLRVEVNPRGATAPVAGLGALLHQMLVNRDQPAALRLLVMQAGSTEPTISLTDLVFQLGQWERPNRRELLNAVYVMLGNLPPPSPIVALPPTPDVHPAGKEAAEPKAVPRARARPWAVIAGALAGGLAIAAVVLLLGARRDVGAPPTQAGSTPPSTPAPDPATSTPGLPAGAGVAVPGRARGIGRAGRDAIARAPIAAPPAATRDAPAPSETLPVSTRASGTGVLPRTARMASAESEFRQAQGLLGHHQYADAVTRFERVLLMIDDGAAGAPELRWMTNEFLTLGKALAEQDAVAAARVYTASDANIVQPVPLGRFLPALPEGTDRGKVVQIVIDATGRVETAKVIGPRIGPRDYWWVAVAKAWRFQPAIKDGRPVKFLASIPIPDESGLPQ